MSLLDQQGTHAKEHTMKLTPHCTACRRKAIGEVIVRGAGIKGKLTVLCTRPFCKAHKPHPDYVLPENVEMYKNTTASLVPTITATNEG